VLFRSNDVHRSSELLAGWPAALQTDPTPTRVFISHLAAAVFSHSTGPGLHRVSCPTVIVTGDDDALLPHHNSRTLARLVPRAHLEVVPGAGHIIPASHPEVVRRALDRARSMVNHHAGTRGAAHAAASE
jgi:pimeloyl-ACP methyl ester carboxylesterase